MLRSAMRIHGSEIRPNTKSFVQTLNLASFQREAPVEKVCIFFVKKKGRMLRLILDCRGQIAGLKSRRESIWPLVTALEMQWR